MGLDSGMGSPHPPWRDGGGAPSAPPGDRHSAPLKLDGLQAPAAFEPFEPGLMDSTRTVPSHLSVQLFPFSSSILTYLFSLLDSLLRGRSTFAAFAIFLSEPSSPWPFEKDLAQRLCTLFSDAVRRPTGA